MAENTAKEKLGRRRRRQEVEVEEEVVDSSITTGKGRATPGRRTKQTEEGGNIVVRNLRGIRGYFKGVRDELDKVSWPTREELVRLSTIVIATLIASAIVLGLISLAFTELFILGFDNVIVFAIMFAVIILGFVAITRYNRNNSSY